MDRLEHAFKDIIKKHSWWDRYYTRMGETVRDWWYLISKAYSEPQRCYHTMDHILAMWTLLDSTSSDEVVDRDAITMAILFHEQVRFCHFSRALLT